MKTKKLTAIGAVVVSLGLVFTALFLAGCDNDTTGSTTPTVTGVRVSPPTATVEKGKTKNFSAVVDGTNNPGQGVEWSIEETGKHEDTTISAEGVLAVSVDEELETLTIMATSTVDTSQNGTSIVTVVAKSYTVSFVGEDGEELADEQTVAEGGTAEEPDEPEGATGFVFGGWYTEEGAKWNFDTNTVTDDIVLYAKWNIKTFTVTFNPRGGNWDGDTADKTETVDWNTAVERPDDPGKARATFKDWYTQQTGGTAFVFTTPLTADITLYAQWDLDPLTNIADISEYLSEQTGGTDGDNPIFLPVQIELGTMTEATSGWQELLTAIATANKFVDLDLSLCTMDGTEFNPDYNVEAGKDKIVSIALPDSAKSILSASSNSNNAFKHFTAIRSFSGSGLASIGGNAFSGCRSLDMTSLPEGITSIGTYAFRDCINLALSSLPEDITSIERYTFMYCRNLTLSSLPAGITSIGNDAFRECAGITLSSLPEGIASIGSNAFFGCTGITLTSLPEGITSIGFAAFSGCTGITSLSIPASVSVDNGDPNGLNPFPGCTSLASFTLIGDGPLSTIEDGRALVRDGVELVSYPAASGEIILPEEITSIHSAFMYCPITQITLPDKLTTIGRRAFYSCRSLEQITLPVGVTTIGGQGFYGCQFSQITLPETITFIGDWAFNSAYNLVLVTCLAETPPELGLRGFTRSDQDIHPDIQIKVPAGSVEAYKAAENWSDYADKISAIE